MPAAWPEERIAVLRDLALKHAASEIAAIMGTTRNAVLGKLFRLGISIGGNSLSDLERRRRDNIRAMARARVGQGKRVRIKRFADDYVASVGPQKARQYVPPPPPPNAPEPRNLAILDLARDECRWPVTADHPMLFCGHPSSSPYCPFHMRQAYQLPRVRIASPR